MNRKKGGESLFNKWNGRFRNALKESLPVRGMIRMGGLEERTEDGFFLCRIKKGCAGLSNRFGLKKKIFRPARVAFSREMEQSAVVHLAGNVVDALLAAPLRAYGVFVLTFALYAFLLSAAGSYLSGEGWLQLTMAVKGGVGAICALPLLMTSKQTTLASGLLQSKICSYLLFGLLGLEKEPFEKTRKPLSGVLVGFLAGMGLATLTLVVSPAEIVGVAFALIFILVSYVRPESSMLLSVLFAPFVSGGVLQRMLIVTAFFFLVKLLRGKRNLKMGVFSSAMLAYALFVLFGGLVTPAGVGFDGAQRHLTLLLAFFLPALLFYRKEWLVSAAGVLSLGVSVAALGTAVLYLTDFIPESYRAFLPVLNWLSELRPFANDFAASIGVLALPIFAVRFMADGRMKSRFSMMVTVALLAIVAVLSRDLGVWISFAFVLTLMQIFYRNISVFPIVAAVAGGILVYFFLLPQGIKDLLVRYSHGFSVDFETVSECFKEGASRLFAGLGVGTAPQNGNLYSTMITELGAVGVVLLLFALFGVLCYAAYAIYNKEGTDRVTSSVTRGFAAAMIGAMVLGVFTDLFANETLTFFLFFLAGMLYAGAKGLCEEGARAVRGSEVDRDYLFIPVIRKEKKKKKVGGAAEANADATEKELELSLDEDGFAEENNEGKRASEDRSIAEKEEEK